ncbi:MAG TPA: helicase C-terminal domain-containing protein [Methanosarcina sp.]|nr:helicase C-terminal domain-containing protein [Methanosarcina sp.]
MTSKVELKEIVDRYFPRPKANPGQKEAIVDACHAILAGKKHVIIDAPTGTGKSIIATTIHRVLKHVKGRWRTTLITSTRSLQDQYTEDDKAIVDLRGKTNYSCPIGVGPYNSGGCRSKIAAGKCSKAQMCPYVKKRTYWCNIAELRITNSSFQISSPPEICMTDENKADLIVIDECHEIDDLIIEHTSIKFNLEDYTLLRRYDGEGLLVSISKYLELFKKYSIGEAFDITDEIFNGMNDISDLTDSMISSLEGMISDDRREDRETIGTALETLQEIACATNLFNACDQRKGTWIMHFYGPGKMEIKPVFAWQVANYSLFRKADYFVHMSATICGYESYIGNLGIKEDNSYLIVVPNSIPVENRNIKVIPTQKVSGNYDIDKLARNIDSLIGMNKGKNGIIHTVSYKLANDIFERSKFKHKMLVSGDRNDIVEFLNTPNGNIVLSPSMVKGYDFKGDTSRFQILAKVPYLWLGDPLVSLNAKERPEWYARKAILSAVQSCGRSVRGVDDWAQTYIIDSNFLRLLQDNHEIFPEWFLDSIDIIS